MKSLLLLLLLIITAYTQQYYNHQSSSLYNATWMSQLNDGIPLRQISIIGSHSSMSQGTWGDAFQTQSNTLYNQMMIGIRALDIRCRHYYDTFTIHDRLVYLNANLQDVLNTVRSFLSAYPSQTIIVHIVEQYNAKGNTQTFEDTYLSYQSLFMDIIWTPTSQNPTLGQVRGKAVILQDFPAANIYGLLYSTFTTLGHKSYSTNWDQYDKWTDVKNFIGAANSQGKSRVSFWTGHKGSFPYFVASGKSSPGNNHPRLATGLTTPGFKSYYPDFPRVACFIGICTIAFEGINKLAYDYIISQSISYLGIVFTDFVGEVVLSKAIALNQNRFSPCSSALLTQGCSYCSSSGQCMGCRVIEFYVYFGGNFSCGAKDGYYLLWNNSTSNTPTLCQLAISGCLKCTSDTICTQCDILQNYQLSNQTCGAAPGYYLDNSSTPVVCTLTGCYRCLSDTICQECSSPNNYIMNNSTQQCECDSANLFQSHPTVNACICMAGYFINANNTCQTMPLCPASNSGCLICSGSACSQCDNANNFITDPSNPALCSCAQEYFYDGFVCLTCNTSLSSACTQCVSQTLCISCLTNFTLSNGDCQCLPQYYLANVTTCLQCMAGCLRCTDGTSCTICDQNNNFTLSNNICVCNTGMYENGGKCELCGAMAGCLDCNTDGCIQCDATFGFTLNASTSQCECVYGQFINSFSLCQKCSSLGCLACTSQTVCLQCNQYFGVVNDVCQEICGDGFLFTLECDDNNTISGDGCSQSCQVQTGYTCVGGSSITPSACSYSGEIIIRVQTVFKDPASNTVLIQAFIQPILASLGDLDFNTVWTPNFPVSSTNTSYDPGTGKISQTFTYDTSLNDRVLSVDFTPPATPQYFYMQASTTTLPATSNNLALKAYSQQDYELADKQQYMVWTVALLASGLFLIALFFGSRLMGIEMIFIFQVGYIGLMMVTKMQNSMVPLRHLKVVCGYSDLIADSSAANLPDRLSYIYLNAFFLSNFIINLVVILIPLIAGPTLLIISKIKQNKQWRIKSYKILKQWLLYALLFSQLMLSISLSLSLQYDDNKFMGLTLGGLIYAGILVYLFLLPCRPQHFGQFKDLFKVGRFSKNWYVFVIVFRMLIGFCIAIMWQNTVVTYIALALTAIWMIVGSILRPYQSNVRPIVNSLVVFTVVAIYLYSNQNKDSTEVTIVTKYMPLFLICLLFAAFLFNLVCIVLYLCFKRKQEKEKEVNDEALMDNNQTSKEMDKEYIQKLKSLLCSQIDMGKGMYQLAQDSPRKEMQNLSTMKPQKICIEMSQIQQKLPQIVPEEEQYSDDSSNPIY